MLKLHIAVAATRSIAAHPHLSGSVALWPVCAGCVAQPTVQVAFAILKDWYFACPHPFELGSTPGLPGARAADSAGPRGVNLSRTRRSKLRVGR